MKLIEKYTPSKGLLIVITFLCCNLGIQLFVITQVGAIEFVGNKIESDIVTLSLFLTYALTMISFLFILSEFFLMRKMESLFTLSELDTIGNSKKENVVEEIIEHNSLELAERSEPVPEPTFPEPPAQTDPVDLIGSLFVSDDEESPKEEEKQKNVYKVLEIKSSDDEEPIEVDSLPKPEFDMDHVQIDSFISKTESGPVIVESELENAIPEFFDESEILQTLTELADVVALLKKRAGSIQP